MQKKQSQPDVFFLWQGKYLFLNYYRTRKKSANLAEKGKKRKSNNLLLKITEWHLCFKKR